MTTSLRWVMCGREIPLLVFSVVESKTGDLPTARHSSNCFKLRIWSLFDFLSRILYAKEIETGCVPNE